MDIHSLVCYCCLSCQSLRLPLWTLPPPMAPCFQTCLHPCPPSCHSYGHSFPPSMWHPLLLPSLEAGSQKEGWSQAAANAYKPNHPICSVDHSAKGNLPQTHPSLYGIVTVALCLLWPLMQWLCYLELWWCAKWEHADWGYKYMLVLQYLKNICFFCSTWTNRRQHWERSTTVDWGYTSRLHKSIDPKIQQI